MEAYQELETEWAKFNDLDPQGMVACASGTATLHLALESLQLPPASEVICSDFNMIAVPRAIVLAGLKPVFVDCGDDLNIDADLMIDQCEFPRSIVATHIYGRRCNMDRVYAAANMWANCDIVEDLAEAHGVKPHPSTDMACWSFYRNKIVAGQEGGAVWFKDVKHAALARQLRSLGFTDKHDFTHVPRGHNYRMSNIHAELVLASLENYAFNKYRRQQVVYAFDAHCPPQWKMPHRDANWVYDFRIPGLTSEKQDQIVVTLNDAGITARHAFKPMSQQDEFRGKCKMVNGGVDELGTYSLSCVAAREVIYLAIDTKGTLFQDQELAELAFAIVRQITTVKRIAQD